MLKKDIKENIKEFKKNAEENLTETKKLDILQPILPEQQSFNQSQEYIQNNVNLYTKEKAFNIQLKDGPYKCTYTQNGGYMLVTSNRGYMASFNSKDFDLCFESSIDDKIYDSKWLHNEMYLATAQEDCVFVYDKNGSELHAVRDMKSTRKLEFLPYHFLLAGTTDKGFLNYLDTSIGEIVSSIFIADKSPTSIKGCLTNGVVHIGSKNGQVSLWAPSQKSFLMKVKCHKASITGIEIDRTGTHMITTGSDNKINVFDIRNTYKPLKSIPTRMNVHFTSLSQRGLLAIGYSDKIAILKDYKDIYMKHRTPGIISSLEFCNHEDILSIGHMNGISSIVIPGSGDPVYDSMEVSPFMSAEQRKNVEVRKLLEKIPADMIGLKSVLGQVETPKEEIKEIPQQKVEEHKRGALSRFFNKV